MIPVFRLALLGVLVGSPFSFCEPGTDDVPDYKDADPKKLLAWEPPEYLKKDYPYVMSGFDDEGSPIWIAEMGKWDVKKSAENGPEAVKNYKLYLLQFLARCAESANKATDSTNYPSQGFNLIVDMSGYNVRQITSPAAISLQLWGSRQFEQAFSRSVKQGYIVNTNFAFMTMWNLMKPILGPSTFKVEVFGSNRGHWLAQILKAYPEDQLPASLGGTQNEGNIKTFG